MDGQRIHIFEELPLSGGSLDGVKRPDIGFVTRGGREMENHFECMWDMYRSIPSLEVPDASYLDEFYWLDKDDPNSSNCRLIHKQGNRLESDGDFTLGTHSKELVKLVMETEESLGAKTIEEVFSKEFLKVIFGLIGLLCLPLRNGIQRLKCVDMLCASSIISVVCLISLH